MGNGMRRSAMLLTLLVLALLPGQSIAQTAITGQVPNFGVPVTGPNQGSPPPDDNNPLGRGYVSMIDSAVPLNTLRIRVDLGYQMPRPTRAEYFMA